MNLTKRISWDDCVHTYAEEGTPLEEAKEQTLQFDTYAQAANEIKKLITLRAHKNTITYKVAKIPCNSKYGIIRQDTSWWWIGEWSGN